MFDSLRTAYARYRLRYPVYLFHHLPKCGGTSVRKTLDSWFHVNLDYPQHGPAPIDLGTLNSHNCVIGHFGDTGYYLSERYPQVLGGFRAAQRYRVFSFVRDPLEMRCSLYRHNLKLGIGKGSHADMIATIMTLNNYLARILNVTKDNWQDTLQRYFFVGNADDLQNSFDLLADLIDRPRVDLPTLNTTQHDQGNTVASLSEAEIAAFKTSNQLDYAIYDWACERLDSLRLESR